MSEAAQQISILGQPAELVGNILVTPWLQIGLDSTSGAAVHVQWSPDEVEATYQCDGYQISSRHFGTEMWHWRILITNQQDAAISVRIPLAIAASDGRELTTWGGGVDAMIAAISPDAHSPQLALFLKSGVLGNNPTSGALEFGPIEVPAHGQALIMLRGQLFSDLSELARELPNWLPLHQFSAEDLEDSELLADAAVVEAADQILVHTSRGTTAVANVHDHLSDLATTLTALVQSGPPGPARDILQIEANILVGRDSDTMINNGNEMFTSARTSASDPGLLLARSLLLNDLDQSLDLIRQVTGLGSGFLTLLTAIQAAIADRSHELSPSNTVVDLEEAALMGQVDAVRRILIAFGGGLPSTPHSLDPLQAAQYSAIVSAVPEDVLVAAADRLVAPAAEILTQMRNRLLEYAMNHRTETQAMSVAAWVVLGLSDLD